MARRKKQKNISLKEFRAWLSGVEELQPKDWSPTADQWKLIRQKIDCIIEIENHQTAINNTADSPPPPEETSQEAIIPPPLVGGVDPAASIEMTSEAKKMLTPVSPGESTKTPNIDTSQNGYQSSFS